MISNSRIKFLFFIVVNFSLNGYSQEPGDHYLQTLPGTDQGIDFRYVPAGSFLMGSPEEENGRESDEGPQTQVHIGAFWMSEFEVTWSLYNLFLQREIDDKVEFLKDAEVKISVDAISGATIPYVDMSLGMGTEGKLPVGNVTWLAATRFCKWLSSVTGQFYRLPTEAEWEYAARAGSKEAYFFNKPEELGDYAWFSENSGNTYHKTGTKKSNPWGLHDMYGNVAEWTFNQYTSEGYKNGLVPITEEYPVTIRGGSYRDGPKDLRSASRQPSKPVWKQRDPQFPKSKWWFTDAPFVGFRIVRPLETPTDKEAFWPDDI